MRGLRYPHDISFSDGSAVSSLLFAELCGTDFLSGRIGIDCADLLGADLRGTPFGIDAPGPDVLPAPDSRYKWRPD